MEIREDQLYGIIIAAFGLGALVVMLAKIYVENYL